MLLTSDRDNFICHNYGDVYATQARTWFGVSGLFSKRHDSYKTQYYFFFGCFETMLRWVNQWRRDDSCSPSVVRYPLHKRRQNKVEHAQFCLLRFRANWGRSVITQHDKVVFSLHPSNDRCFVELGFDAEGCRTRIFK